MQFGYCVNMIARDAWGVGHENIPMLAHLGFDYVELPIAQLMDMDEDTLRDSPIALLKESGLPCRSCNNFFPGSHRLTGPDADHARALAYADAALDRAASLGAKRVVFGSSGARNAPIGFPPDRAGDQLAEILTRLAPMAESRGITLVIEHLNIAESNLVNRFADGLALAKTVDHPAVAVLADYYHLRMMQDTSDAIPSAGRYLQHVHIARTLLRSLPLPGDGEDYAALFAAFRAAGYDGTVSIEAYMPGQNAADLAVSLAHLRSFAG